MIRWIIDQQTFSANRSVSRKLIGSSGLELALLLVGECGTIGMTVVWYTGDSRSMSSVATGDAFLTRFCSYWLIWSIGWSIDLIDRSITHTVCTTAGILVCGSVYSLSTVVSLFRRSIIFAACAFTWSSPVTSKWCSAAYWKYRKKLFNSIFFRFCYSKSNIAHELTVSISFRCCTIG